MRKQEKTKDKACFNWNFLKFMVSKVVFGSNEQNKHISKISEINENDIEEIDERQINQTENGEEVIVLRRNVMTELNRSLSSRLAGTKSLCHPTDVLKPKTNQNRPSDIFTQRLRSHNHNSQDGIENPTSL